MNQDTDIFAAAEAEIAGLDAELKALAEKQRRRDALAAWVAEGRRLLAVKPSAHGLDASTASEETERQPRENTKKAVIADAAAGLIGETGRPMPTRELVAAMKAMGIEIGGADEVDTVSVILNRSGGRFKSLGRKIGWALSTEDQKEATPQVAPTTAGS